MRSTATAAALLGLLCLLAVAYEPPVDTAGPLTVRIQAPAAGSYGSGGFLELTRPDAPFTITVALSNSGDTPLKGSLRLGVIDRWRAEPAGPVPFAVEPRRQARLEFTVRFGQGTFNAHYPVHAFAEFEHQGQRLVAHPILILTTRMADPPRAPLPVAWKPLAVPETGALGLWRIPVRRERVALTAEQTQAGATGREIFEASPAVQYGVRVSRGQTREALSVTLGMRPPSMRERLDMAVIEYPLALPKTEPLRFQFAAAVSDPAAREGATFRVRALPFEAPSGQEGTVLVERRVGSAVWQEADVDLSRFAGQNIRLQLETRASGEVYWAEPTVVAGTPPAERAFPPAADRKYRVLGTAAGYQVRLWPGNRGVLDAVIGLVNGERRVLFQGFRARVSGDALEQWRSASQLLEAREEAAGGRYRVRHRFRNWAGTFDLLSELWVENGGLQARFWLENVPAPRPWLHVYLEEVTAGSWSERAVRVYGGPGNVIQDPQAFRLNYDGHSLATSFVGFDFANGVSLLQGADVTPDRLEVDPQARIYSLNTPHAQTITFLPAANVWEAVKLWRDRNGLGASAGVERLAGRFVFDLWSGRYGESARALRRAFRYGLTDAVVIWHGWQRWGYDFRLPDIFPPNPQYGSFDEFRELVRVCREQGVLFAPHDNYIDFYPDAEGFSYENLAFTPNGQPRRAWFNMGRQAQSYRGRADRARPFVERNLRLIREGFDPTAYFIDVWSSIAPYDYWTHDGQFVERSLTRKVWGEAFAWIRDYLGSNAPQISEAGHDQLIGWLDGAQANQLRVDPNARGFAWNIRCADAERIPWFDAAYHDRFILHGAGYQDRYAAGLDLRSHGMYSDDYMATEVMTGRPAMVSMPFSRDVVRKYWLLHAPMRALALRRIQAVEFAGGDLHRQRIGWDNGAEVWVNRGPGEWNAGGHLLPQYGFYARVPTQEGLVETTVESLGGRRVEWTRSPALYYVNGRGETVNFGAAETSGACRLSREAQGLRITAAPDSPAFQVRLRWSQLAWKLPAPRQAQALDENGTARDSAPLRRDGDDILLEYAPGVFAYRLR